MPKQKAQPLPDMTVHNLRRRAEQMRVIAKCVEDKHARAVLLQKAEKLIETAEQAMQDAVGS